MYILYWSGTQGYRRLFLRDLVESFLFTRTPYRLDFSINWSSLQTKVFDVTISIERSTWLMACQTGQSPPSVIVGSICSELAL